MARPFPSNPLLRALDLARIYLRATPASRRDRDRFAHVRAYVSFIGHSRSGHSLPAALLNAHAGAVIAHEEAALQYVNAGFDRDRIFSLLLRNTREISHSDGHGVKGRRGGYTYDVAGQWQGRADRIEVIGDKHGEYNATRLGEAPHLARRLRDTVRVPTRYVHVVRNPFDNVSTMARRAAEEAGAAPDVDAAARHYEYVCACIGTARTLAGPASLYTLRHEAFVADPAGELAALCTWLGLDADPAYVADCAAVVFPSPRRTRDAVTWTRDARRRLERLIERTPFLRGYTLEA